MKDKWLIPSIIILLIFLIIKLIDQSKLIFYFPLSQNNDITAHMALLYFLAKYGYYSLVPNWYNGFILFKLYPPAWYFFTLPIYYLTKNIQLSTYISILLILTLGFIFLYFTNPVKNLSKIKKIAFFAFFFANPIAVGNFIKLGRPHELLSWVLFIPLFYLIIIYKKTKIDLKFLIFFTFLYSILLLSYPGTAIFIPLFLLPLFFLKHNLKEKSLIISSLFLVLLLTAFWLIPFITSQTQESEPYLKTQLFKNHSLNTESLSVSFLIIIFWIIFYFHYKNKKEFLFYFPTLILTILLFTRLIIFIPIFNNAHPDTYNFFLIFLTIFLFLETNIYIYPKLLRKLLPYCLTLLALLGILIYFIIIPSFIVPDKIDNNILIIMPYISDEYLLLGFGNAKTGAFYSYGAIYYNLSTPSGWLAPQSPQTHIKTAQLNEYLEKKDCLNIKKLILELKAKELLTYNNYCKILKNCNLKEKITEDNACLYILNS